jgi:hypothetical protein
VNDKTWRNLSAALGVACVILIIAAGALLATSGESSTPTNPPASIALESPTDSGTSPSIDESPSADVQPSPTSTATPAPAIQAHIAQITFNNLQLDATNDPLGKARTFTFITDGKPGVNVPIGISFTTVSPAKAQSKICAYSDGSGSCVSGTHYTFTKAAANSLHEVWSVTMMGVGSNTPVVNLTLSWPSAAPRVQLTHGRLQGSSSPGVSANLNGFTATFTPKVAGTLGVSASWTQITTDVRITTSNVAGNSSNLLDQKTFNAAQNLGPQGYSFGLSPGKIYRVELRNLSADSQRPDLTAVISLP